MCITCVAYNGGVIKEKTRLKNVFFSLTKKIYIIIAKIPKMWYIQYVGIIKRL